jgi:hypothetical protein
MEHLLLFCLACGIGVLLLRLVFVPYRRSNDEDSQRGAPAPASEGHLVRR